jgi:hypothetical protein
MPFPNVFTDAVVHQLSERINKLNQQSTPLWGSMQCAQMLAHCNVTYEMVYTDKHKKPKGIAKWLIKTFIKKPVTNEVPYAKNSRTAREFIVKDAKMFDVEKNRLIDFINKTQQLGESHFDGKESHSFGALTKTEWNNLFYKHLDHHLSQFGV